MAEILQPQLMSLQTTRREADAEYDCVLQTGPGHDGHRRCQQTK